ncbi:MAG: GerMN domain-containing protein, partial [Peptococcaceae bacterium]|nr:GerMN domain-containing protein [Peptococcaceae bacterium]
EQIIQSLTDLETVDSVQFLLDGKKAETLMGHMSIADPFTK